MPKCENKTIEDAVKKSSNYQNMIDSLKEEIEIDDYHPDVAVYVFLKNKFICRDIVGHLENGGSLELDVEYFIDKSIRVSLIKRTWSHRDYLGRWDASDASYKDVLNLIKQAEDICIANWKRNGNGCLPPKDIANMISVDNLKLIKS